MLLIRLDENRVLFALTPYGGPPGARVVDRFGRETRFELRGRSAYFRQAPDGTLLLSHEAGVAVVDPVAGFAMRELAEVSLSDPRTTWEVSFFDKLVDVERGCFARFELDDEALQDDPETGPTDAILLPDRQTVAVTIHRTPHLAMYRPLERSTTLVPIEGVSGGGAGDAVVRGMDLWFSGYHTLHRLNLDTMALQSSEVLQPPHFDAELRMDSQRFTGSPHYSDGLSAWLVPRPYSGDILVVSEITLAPTGVIRTGGRPHDVAEFSDGTLLVLDHPFDVVRLAHIADAAELG